MKTYDNSFKKALASNVVDNKKSPSQIAPLFDIPLKTLEKWITAYRKNPQCYDDVIVATDLKLVVQDKQIELLKRENDILKIALSETFDSKKKHSN